MSTADIRADKEAKDKKNMALLASALGVQAVPRNLSDLVDTTSNTLLTCVGFTESADRHSMWIFRFLLYIIDELSGIDGTRELFLGEVVHEAFVAVNEEGTEAVAATAAVALAGGAPAPHEVELTLDRPFLFLIRERRTGAILFLGRVSDPTQD